MLVLDHLSKVFDHTPAVRELSLRIEEGVIFGLLGPNGAGKTTTIRMLLQILQPDSGRILLNGAPIGRADLQHFGYLPEERGLYQKTKIRETIRYFAGLKELDAQIAKSRIDDLLERFGLQDEGERRIEELSKGNQQKVQFIIAIVHAPKIVVLDEPFAGLDPVNQLLLKEVIREMKEEGTTILFSTHQMDQVEKLCEQICLIHNGSPILDGNLAEIRERYGNRTIRVHYEGDAHKLADLPLHYLDLSDKKFVAEMGPDTSLDNVLAQLIPMVRITHFSVLEPSLEQIFIDQVQGAGTQ